MHCWLNNSSTCIWYKTPVRPFADSHAIEPPSPILWDWLRFDFALKFANLALVPSCLGRYVGLEPTIRMQRFTMHHCMQDLSAGRKLPVNGAQHEKEDERARFGTTASLSDARLDTR